MILGSSDTSLQLDDELEFTCETVKVDCLTLTVRFNCLATLVFCGRHDVGC